MRKIIWNHAVVTSCLFFAVGVFCSSAIAAQFLGDAVREGKVMIEVRGLGGSTGDVLELKAKRLTPSNIHLAFTRGTVFQSKSGAVQNMIGSKIKGVRIGSKHYSPQSEITLFSDDWRTYVIEAFCLDFNKPNPSITDTFEIAAPDLDVTQIISAGMNKNLSVNAIQSAIWIYRDNISASKLKQRFPVSDSDIARARSLLENIDENPIGGSLKTTSSKVTATKKTQEEPLTTEISPSDEVAKRLVDLVPGHAIVSRRGGSVFEVSDVKMREQVIEKDVQGAPPLYLDFIGLRFLKDGFWFTRSIPIKDIKSIVFIDAYVGKAHVNLRNGGRVLIESQYSKPSRLAYVSPEGSVTEEHITRKLSIESYKTRKVAVTPGPGLTDAHYGLPRFVGTAHIGGELAEWDGPMWIFAARHIDRIDFGPEK